MDKTYVIKLIAEDGNLVSEAVLDAENAIAALEQVLDNGLLWVPYGVTLRALVGRPDQVVFSFDLATAS